MTSANLNFTQRRKIKSNLVDVTIKERNDDFIRVALHMDSKALNSVEGYRLVLDAFDRGQHERKVISNPADQDFDFDLFPIDANLRFKIRQVSSGIDTGRVIAATADIRPVEAKGQTERKPFIVPEIEDLGGLPWQIVWEGDIANPKLVLNSRLSEHFGSWHHPALQALYLPSMVRDLLSGIIARHESLEDLDEDTLGSRIFEFCRVSFDPAMPSTPFHGKSEIDDEWLKWIEECVVSFSETKWRNGKSLMDQMLESGS